MRHTHLCGRYAPIGGPLWPESGFFRSDGLTFFSSLLRQAPPLPHQAGRSGRTEWGGARFMGRNNPNWYQMLGRWLRRNMGVISGVATVVGVIIGIVR
ncbi:hypothetical protein GCM10010193_58020 [Kitasatospora atroaurantiaca]